MENIKTYFRQKLYGFDGPKYDIIDLVLNSFQGYIKITINLLNKTP